MLTRRRRFSLPAAGICALIATGCGSSAPPARVPTVSEMAKLRAHLADARTAVAHRDRQAATTALEALGADVALLRREGMLGAPLATTLATDVAQARSRATIELPAPAPVAAVPAATTAAAPPAPAPVPAPATAPPAGGDHGKAKGHGKPKDAGKPKGGKHGGD